MVSRRALETATALLTGAFGATVAVSSLDNGIGWSRAGVESGTFPFIIGLTILFASLFNLVRGWLRASGTVISRSDLRRTATLFLPATLYVAVIPLLGLYVASAAYLFGALRVQKGVGTMKSLVIALTVAIALYVVFERAFQVSLPHGVLGAALDW
jgi:hypothetical protein